MSTLYNLLTSPFGLPINPLWEWVILLVVGEVVHEIAWNASPGGRFGSIIYWVTKILAFIAIWAILYGIITAIKFVILHWIWFTVGGGVLLAATLGWIIWHKKKGVKNNESFDYSKYMLFHLIPDTFLDSSYNQPLLALERRNGSFSRIFQTVSCTSLSQPIIEGLRYRHFRNIDNTECRLYNNGIAECFLPLYPYYLQPERQGNSFFNEESVWGHIDDIIKEYASVMAPLLRIHRVYTCITICGCKKAVTAFNMYNAPVGVIDRDRLTCNPIVFEDISNNESIDLDKKRLRLDYLLSLGIRVPDKINDLITEVYGE